MSAQEIIVSTIRNRVAFMNMVKETATVESMERFRHELSGMLLCLKNVSSSNEFYNVNYLDSGYEFGYYDEHGKWYSIEE